MSFSDEQRKIRAEQALVLYEAIEAIAIDQGDPRWRQAALLLPQLRDFGPEPEPEARTPIVVSGAVPQWTGGDAALATDRAYEGFAQ